MSSSATPSERSHKWEVVAVLVAVGSLFLAVIGIFIARAANDRSERANDIAQRGAQAQLVDSWLGRVATAIDVCRNTHGPFSLEAEALIAKERSRVALLNESSQFDSQARAAYIEDVVIFLPPTCQAMVGGVILPTASSGASDTTSPTTSSSNTAGSPSPTSTSAGITTSDPIPIVLNGGWALQVSADDVLVDAQVELNRPGADAMQVRIFHLSGSAVPWRTMIVGYRTEVEARSDLERTKLVWPSAGGAFPLLIAQWCQVARQSEGFVECTAGP
jgi:hypothetical protein